MRMTRAANRIFCDEMLSSAKRQGGCIILATNRTQSLDVHRISMPLLRPSATFPAHGEDKTVSDHTLGVLKSSPHEGVRSQRIADSCASRMFLKQCPEPGHGKSDTKGFVVEWGPWASS